LLVLFLLITDNHLYLVHARLTLRLILLLDGTEGDVLCFSAECAFCFFVVVKMLPRDAYALCGRCRGKKTVRLSVRLSVCHTPVFCMNGYTYPQSFFTIG